MKCVWLNEKDEHDLYPGEELKEFSSSQYLAILLARFMKSKRQKVNSFLPNITK
ncbi:hypothetical protein ACT7CU_24250 [Bacillus paranthracis]